MVQCSATPLPDRQAYFASSTASLSALLKEMMSSFNDKLKPILVNGAPNE